MENQSMDPFAPTTAAQVINLLLPEFPSLATITTSTTGTPAVAGINPSLVKTFNSFKYTTQVGDQEFESLKEIDIATQGFNSFFDLLFLDSWHTYKDSLEILEIGIRIAKPNSIILVHDCLAHSSSLSSTYVPGAWSGVTCFVFREFAKTVNREWFVLDSDHGLGVLGPETNTKQSLINSVDLELLEKSELENLKQFYENSRQYMRGIAPSRFQEALKRIRSGESPEYLVAGNQELINDSDRNRIHELENELNLIKNSRTWRATSLYRRLRK
jgi:hypothetical protein